MNKKDYYILKNTNKKFINGYERFYSFITFESSLSKNENEIIRFTK